LALGLGSLFNHSIPGQNVCWRRDLSNTCIVYTALRNIEPGEELCISYGSKLWFEDTEVVGVRNEERGIDVAGIDGDEGSTYGDNEELAMLRLVELAVDTKL
jgi:SET domain-containing protein